jgi:DNA modification methylase/transcriptional regulator with XRE-family HTH domain
MGVYFSTDRASLHNGDCRIALRDLSDSSVDSVVCDPPYELGFMGKGWDRSGIAYDVSVWSECLRVLKPGSHLLAFGGSRTYHRLACAIEDAGFEIRDQIMWIYGSGFPKSLDVGKAIDSRGGRSVAWFGPWLRRWRTERGILQSEVAALFPSRNGGATGCVANWELGLNMPTPEQFNLICSTYDLPYESLAEAERQIVGKGASGKTAIWNEAGTMGEYDLTAPSSDAAKQWNGWGTALKPAHEPIVLARKPLIGTVAENVLQHGTGGLNIDGCRIEPTGERLGGGSELPKTFSKPDGWDRPWMHDEQHTAAHAAKVSANVERATELGRWPANVCHDGSDQVLAAFPDAPGQQGDLSGHSKDRLSKGIFGDMKAARDAMARLDSGSAARFFYCAKASQDDRNEGLEDLPLRSAGEVTDRKDGSAGLNSPRAGAGRNNGSRNPHPTVKPTDLMRYLCRLVTPPGGTVLDPFCGSGSTGKAAMLEGLNFIGIELSAEYCELAQRRIEAVTKQGLLFATA